MTDPQSARAGKVYFVRRSLYEVPLGHRVTEYASPDVLRWFQDHWIRGEFRSVLLKLETDATDLRDRLHAYADELLNGSLYGFEEVFHAMLRWGEQPPESVDRLRDFVASIEYYGEITFLEGAIQCITDDDEIEISWLLFDDAFASANPDRIAFLLECDWRLSTDADETGMRIPEDPARELTVSIDESCPGATYAVFLSALDGETLTDMTGARRFERVRIPTFAAALRSAEVPIRQGDHRDANREWPEELILLRALSQLSDASGLAGLLREHDPAVMNDKLSPARAFSDLRHSLKQPDFLAGDRDQCVKDFARLAESRDHERVKIRSAWSSTMMPPLILTSDHFCQVRFHQRFISEGNGTHSYGWSYLFFDDQWIAANRDLAQSILHYAKGWQVLYEAEPLVSM